MSASVGFSSMLLGTLFVADADAGDPLLTLAWTAEGEQDDAYFGQSVSTAGDVNRDGFGDVIVGTGWFDDSPLVNAGRACLYLGSSEGLGGSAAWTATGLQDRGYFASSVASAGDVNGDGYGDVVVGAYAYSDPKEWEGSAYVYLGSASGLEATSAWFVEGGQEYATFGTAVASAGDVNGDGYDDVVVGAPVYESVEKNEGRVYLYLGSATGLETASAWSSAGPGAPYSYFGGAVSGAGDVNGDGYDDVVVGARNYGNGEVHEGGAFLFLGSASGLGAPVAWSAESDSVEAQMGVSVASAGDVNGDGYDDVVVGAWGYNGDEAVEGKAYLYLGSSSGLEATAAWTATGGIEAAMFGVSVASAGDVNGDGYADVVVGAEQYDHGGTMPGFVSVFLGSASGLGASASWSTDSGQAGSAFGYSVSGAGDVDGDGVGDLVVGATRYSNGSDAEGGAFVYLGGEAGAADTDADDDGVDDDVDCDDANAKVFPGAPEICDDAIDNDCDKTVDEDCDGGDDGDAGGGGDDGSDSSGEDDPGCGCGSTRGASGYALLVLAALARRSRRAIE